MTLPDEAIYSPDEIVQRIKSNLHKPTEGNTETAAETGHELELPKKQLSQRALRNVTLLISSLLSFDGCGLGRFRWHAPDDTLQCVIH